MLRGRLGIETARVPQVDRHGLIWLGRGRLYVEEGTLRFGTLGKGDLPPGNFGIPFQMLSCILLAPGTAVTHDAMRLLARHGTGLVAVAEDGVRFYASMPFGPDQSERARQQARMWADSAGERVRIARLMYGWRLGEILPATDMNALRGMEGARMKETYRRVAEQVGIQWRGRRYDRTRPKKADIPNQALNHAATAVLAAAEVAVAITGTIPQLGFIHEDSGLSFCLDIADLFRDSITIPVAFSAARDLCEQQGSASLERYVRQHAGHTVRKEKVIPRMIDRIKELLDADDHRCDE